MPHHVAPIPEGYHSVTPSITTRNAAQAIEFYKKALGAEELMRMPGPNGQVMHAEIKIGNSIVMVNDEFPDWGIRAPQTLGGTPVSLFLYVNDVDRAYQRAIAAGATAIMEPRDQFWGDRFGKLRDPYGHEWALATHIEDVSPEECMRRGAEAMKQGCGEKNK
jgi:PhnB protein